MINKQSIWFLTLFALVLVLGIYYITMPSGVLLESKEVNLDNSETKILESDLLASLRVKRDEESLKTMEELENKLTDEDITPEEKNSVFEELKLLNLAKGKETSLEDKINKELNIKSFVKIDSNDIYVTINSKEHNYELANKIMRCIQEEYEDKVNVIVKFE